MRTERTIAGIFLGCACAGFFAGCTPSSTEGDDGLRVWVDGCRRNPPGCGIDCGGPAGSFDGSVSVLA